MIARRLLSTELSNSEFAKAACPFSSARQATGSSRAGCRCMSSTVGVKSWAEIHLSAQGPPTVAPPREGVFVEGSDNAQGSIEFAVGPVPGLSLGGLNDGSIESPLWSIRRHRMAPS
jgi:hypothetical protein